MSDGTKERWLPPNSLPTRRWLLAAALLVAEYVVALLVFDSQRMPITRDTKAFALIGESMPLIIVVMTATLLIGSGPSKAEMSEIAAAFRQRRRTWPLFVGHLLAYALAIGITIFVFNPGLELERPWLWVVLWAASSVCSFFLLVAAVVPKAALRPVAKPAARALAVGLVVGVLAMLAGGATSVLWRPMSRLTLEVVAFLLELTGHEVVGIPEDLVIGTPTYEVFVDQPCSGYEGIGLITVMLGFYLFSFRKSLRFPNALLLLPIGIVLIWIANSIRIAALIAVGTWISPEVAEGGFHSAAGWLLFCTITLGLVAVSRQSGWFALHASQRVLTPLIPLWIFRGYYADLRWSWAWTPIFLGLFVFVLWVALEPAPTPETVALIPRTLREMPVAAAAFWLIARVLGSSIVVPIAEELAFRGYLLRRLIDADFTAVSPKQFTWASFLISSVAFGALHGRWVAGILAGMIYAAAQYRRGRISDAIVAHSVTNALLAAYVVIFGHWGFW
jgi:CAAX prenyl protease-like protein